MIKCDFAIALPYPGLQTVRAAESRPREVVPHAVGQSKPPGTAGGYRQFYEGVPNAAQKCELL